MAEEQNAGGGLISGSFGSISILPNKTMVAKSPASEAEQGSMQKIAYLDSEGTAQSADVAHYVIEELRIQLGEKNIIRGNVIKVAMVGNEVHHVPGVQPRRFLLREELFDGLVADQTDQDIGNLSIQGLLNYLVENDLLSE